MSDLTEQDEIEIGVGAAVAAGLLALLVKCFAGRGQQQGAIRRYGFAWQPNTQFANFQVTTLRTTDAPGLYVAFEQPNIDQPAYFFDNAADGIGIIFPLLAAPLPGFAQAVQGLTNDVNLQCKLEGFLIYAHRCLDYIYATAAGQLLIDGLRQGNQRTYIKPSAEGNQIQGGGDKLCLVTRAIVTLDLNLAAADRAALLQVLAQASAQAVQLAQFQWLAQQVNGMPLFTLFEQAHQLTPTFLQTNRAVTAPELQDWFVNGPNSHFIQNLATAQPVAGVELVKFLKIAVIAALYADSPRGQGGESTMFFDLHDWSQCNLAGVDQNANGPNDRPPAIGLAHELIHAYHNSRGAEPGSEIGDYSTTLAEAICVGLPPFAGANFNITENRIRAAWPPVAFPAAGDPLNLRAVGQRTIYTAPPGVTTAAQMRQGAGGRGAI